MIYKRNGDGLKLESTGFGSGRIVMSEGSSGAAYTPNYFLTDHLGSTRAVVNAQGNVIEQNDYYPFGSRHENPQLAVSDNRFRFSGKEDQTTGDLPYQDFGARFLGGKLPIFSRIDRFAEKDHPRSPYNSTRNNPIIYTDPTGDSVRVYTETAGFGHACISTGEGENMTVYSYGRYDGTNKGPERSSNSLSNGPGTLLKLSGAKAQEYNNRKAEKTGMSVFVITDVSDKAIGNIIDDMFYSSENMPSHNPENEYYFSPFAHVIDEYKLTSNNCTTFVSDALNKAGSKVLHHPAKFIPQTINTCIICFTSLASNSFIHQSSTKSKFIYRKMI